MPTLLEAIQNIGKKMQQEVLDEDEGIFFSEASIDSGSTLPSFDLNKAKSALQEIADIDGNSAESQLLLTAIDATADLDLLKNLILAQTPEQQKNAMKALVNVAEILDAIPPSSLASAKFQYVNKVYLPYVDNLDLNTLTPIFNSKDLFESYMHRQFEGVDFTDQTELAQERLATRYLQYVWEQSPRSIDELNKIDNVDAMIQSVTERFNDKFAEPNDIKRAVNEETIPTLKNITVDQFIKKTEQYSALVPLTTAKNITDFKSALEAFGVKPADWVTDDFMAGFQKSANQQMVAVRADQIKKLTELFKTVKLDKLVKLLTKETLTDFKDVIRDNSDWIDNACMGMVQLKENAWNALTERRQNILIDPRVDDNAKQTLISGVAQELATLIKKQKKDIAAFPKLEGLLTKDLSGPAFYADIKSKPAGVSEHYDALLQQTNSGIELLQNNKKKMESYKTIFNASGKGTSQYDLKSLKSAQNSLDSELDKQEKIQAKITQVLSEIRGALSGKKEYLYKSEGITHSTCTHEQYEALLKSLEKDKSTVVNPGAPPLVIKPGKASESIFKETELGNNKYYVYTLENKAVSSKGVFVQSIAPSPVSVTKGESTKPPRSLITMLQEPLINDASGNPVPHEVTVEFYMNMAIAAIVARGGKAPTAEDPLSLEGGTPEQMELLWTAFMVLGKEKLNFGMEAIKTEKQIFDPNNVMTAKSMVFSRTFGETSLHKKYFQPPKSSSVVQDKLKDVDTIIADAQKTTKEMSAAAQITNSYKGGMKEARGLSDVENSDPNIDGSDLRHSI
jgi:hypothetical protein